MSPEGGPRPARMKKGLLTVVLAAGVLVAATTTGFTIPVAAQQEVVWVQLPTGEIVPVEVPPGTDPASMELPGPIVPPPTTTEPPASPETPTTPAPEPPPPAETTSAPEPTPAPGPAPATPQPGPAPVRRDGGPGVGGGSPQERSNSGVRIRREGDEEGDRERKGGGRVRAEPEDEAFAGAAARPPPAVAQRRRHARRGTTPASSTPSRARRRRPASRTSSSASSGCRSSCSRSTRPPAIEYGIRWEVLAAINEIETDYGRNLNVSSRRRARLDAVHAGDVEGVRRRREQGRQEGPVQPGRRDLRRGPLPEGGGLRAATCGAAIFAYNHADWYVDSVAAARHADRGHARRPRRVAHGPHRGPLPGRRARALRGRPVRDRGPQARPARRERRPRRSSRATTRRGIDIFASKGSPVVAVNDGVVKKIGRTNELGRYVVLQDVYGNRFTYAHLGSVSKNYPVPKRTPTTSRQHRKAVKATARTTRTAAPARLGRPPARRLGHRLGRHRSAEVERTTPRATVP